jgi:hypothetical protein
MNQNGFLEHVISCSWYDSCSTAAHRRDASIPENNPFDERRVEIKTYSYFKCQLLQSTLNA